MAPYRIILLKADGSVKEEQRREFANDDQAIDATGWSSHPHQIRIEQGSRLVAEFPSLFQVKS